MLLALLVTSSRNSASIGWYTYLQRQNDKALGIRRRLESSERVLLLVCIARCTESMHRQEWLLRCNSPHCVRLYKCMLLLLAAAQELGERSQETLLTAHP